MATAKPESRLQTKIKDAIVKAYPEAFIVKVHGSGYQRAGMPDLVGCVAGRYVGLEVKMPGKEDTVTRLQEAALSGIRKAGGVAAAVTTPAQALDILEEAL